MAGIAKAYSEALVVSQKEWVALASKFIQKDETTGNFKIDEKGPVWLEGVKPEDAEAAIDEYLLKETIIEAPKIALSDVAGISLSPNDIVSLDPVLTE